MNSASCEAPFSCSSCRTNDSASSGASACGGSAFGTGNRTAGALSAALSVALGIDIPGPSRQGPARAQRGHNLYSAGDGVHEVPLTLAWVTRGAPVWSMLHDDPCMPSEAPHTDSQHHAQAHTPTDGRSHTYMHTCTHHTTHARCPCRPSFLIPLTRPAPKIALSVHDPSLAADNCRLI